MIERDTKLLKSEVIERYNELLERAARWLAGEGVTIKYEPMYEGGKEMTLIGHTHRMTFTAIDVERIMKCLEEGVDDRLEDPEGRWKKLEQRRERKRLDR